jgi:hypothetical protein
VTARAEYTHDEWVLLLAAPQAAIGAVAFADGAGLLEIVAEGFTAAVAQAHGKERYPGNELIGALIGNTERVDPANIPQPQEVGEDPAKVRARLIELAVDRCCEAMKLLQERANAAEASGYAEWVMEAARAAATARRHKEGWLAAKGPAVDAEERAVLAKIADALGVEVGELPAEPDAVQDGPQIPGGAIQPK